MLELENDHVYLGRLASHVTPKLLKDPVTPVMIADLMEDVRIETINYLRMKRTQHYDVLVSIVPHEGTVPEFWERVKKEEYWAGKAPKEVVLRVAVMFSPQDEDKEVLFVRYKVIYPPQVYKAKCRLCSSQTEGDSFCSKCRKHKYGKVYYLENQTRLRAYGKKRYADRKKLEREANHGNN